jgi:hypothetical protein
VRQAFLWSTTINGFWLLGFLLAIQLCGCSGYTPGGRLATRDEAIMFFEKNKSDFEAFRDLLLAEKASTFIVFDTGNFTMPETEGSRPSEVHVRDYVARLKKLGLPCASKIFVDEPSYPLVTFGLSAVGLVGDGPSIDLTFTKGKPPISNGLTVKIEKSGWYLSSNEPSKE